MGWVSRIVHLLCVQMSKRSRVTFKHTQTQKRGLFHSQITDESQDIVYWWRKVCSLHREYHVWHHLCRRWKEGVFVGFEHSHKSRRYIVDVYLNYFSKHNLAIGSSQKDGMAEGVEWTGGQTLVVIKRSRVCVGLTCCFFLMRIKIAVK